MKIFGIGLPKTGTASLDRALTELGFKVTGPNKSVLATLMSGDLKPTLALSQEYDAFQDWPWPLVYKKMNELYGENSKFILTIRSSAESWFKSLCDHAMQYRTPFQKHAIFYGYYLPFGREKEHIKFYNSHNASVIQYFKDNNIEHRLLVISFDSGEGWTELCNFLNVSIPTRTFPHANRRADKKVRYLRYIINLVFSFTYRSWIKLVKI